MHKIIFISTPKDQVKSILSAGLQEELDAKGISYLILDSNQVSSQLILDNDLIIVHSLSECDTILKIKDFYSKVILIHGSLDMATINALSLKGLTEHIDVKMFDNHRSFVYKMKLLISVAFPSLKKLKINDSKKDTQEIIKSMSDSLK